jgi:uncharacterized ParB-like nuclease family protein
MSLRALSKRVRQMELTIEFNGFHLIYAYIGTPELEADAEKHIARETAYAKVMRKLPFVFKVHKV